MKMMKHIQTWLLITLLALSASGVANAKLASGHQNLSGGVHQSQTVLNALLHKGLEEVSTTYTSGSPLAAKGLLGQSGRNAFGKTKLRGLNQNRPLSELTDTDIRKTFKDSPFTLTNHAISRILDPRTRGLGARTPNDIAGVLNNGTISDAGRGLISIRRDGLEAIVNAGTKTVVTIKPVR